MNDGAAVGGGGFAGGVPGGGGFVGGGFAGGPPDGGFGSPGGFGGGNADPDAIATRQATFADGNFDGQSGSFLINPLITLLEIRAGEREAQVPGQGGFFGGGFTEQVIEAVTAETSLTTEEIQAQQADGSTLTEIIEAKGGDVDTVKAALEESLSGTEIPEGQTLEGIIDNILNNSFQQPSQTGDS
ncbi:MAG: hypothetical protein WAM60_10480 [Candidatus Promineifilaceae bacterium]